MDVKQSITNYQPFEKAEWRKIIEPKTGLFNLRLNELWRYRDLIMMFVQRDFVANFKQTILGPLWFFIQPLMTTALYILVFGNIAQLSTDGTPMLLFYLSGITIWNYFAETLNRTASIFNDNAGLFGKVYFPRLTMPISIVISNLMRFSIQFALFMSIWIFYLVNTDTIRPQWTILLMPFLIFIMGVLALGLGMIISSLTSKYKDLTFLIAFGVQLLMFATPVIYPLSSVPDNYKKLILANPISPVVETFRFSFLGSGSFQPWNLLYSGLCALIILGCGIIIFNKVEKTFTDTV